MQAFKETLTEWRHYLHQHPESAFEEVNTSRFIAERLTEMGYTVHTGIGKTGIVADLTVGDGKKILGLRADIDSLSQPEQGNPPYKSVNEGKMHGCGHDGHITTLLGAAWLIAERKNFNGTVRLVFQPAEEPGYGADAMIADGLLSEYPIDEIYGLHNQPMLPFGTISTRVGGVMGSEDDFVIKIHGKGGHASSPHFGIDPLVIASQIILALQTISARSANPVHPVVVSCTEILTDGSHNAIPSNVTILGDTRSTSPEDQALIESRMRSIVSGICEAAGASWEFEYTHEFMPTVNTKECVQAAVAAAQAVVGPENVNGDCEPSMVSEDFAKYLLQIPGCFVLLGTGTVTPLSDNLPLHNPKFDYNDEALTVGAEFFAKLVEMRLN